MSNYAHVATCTFGHCVRSSATTTTTECFSAIRSSIRPRVRCGSVLCALPLTPKKRRKKVNSVYFSRGKKSHEWKLAKSEAKRRGEKGRTRRHRRILSHTRCGFILLLFFLHAVASDSVLSFSCFIFGQFVLYFLLANWSFFLSRSFVRLGLDQNYGEHANWILI